MKQKLKTPKVVEKFFKENNDKIIPVRLLRTVITDDYYTLYKWTQKLVSAHTDGDEKKVNKIIREELRPIL